MTVQETLSQLQSHSDEKVRQMHIKNGARENLFGVKMGDIRALAKRIKTDQKLALQLWETENIDARLLAILILKPRDLLPNEIEKMVASESFTWAADWFYNYVVKDYPNNEQFRERWINANNKMLARAGWSLTSGRVARNSEGLDLDALLNRIEAEMPKAASETQWTMNTTLAQVGIHHPEFRARALSIGEKLGIYRDYPVSKGCTSPFAPIWINEMVNRQKF